MGSLFSKNSKRLIFVVSLLGFAFILSGCGASLSLSIDPNPIRFDVDNLEQDVTVTLRTSGIGSVDIDYMDVLILDNEDEEIYSETIEIDESSFVVPGVEVQEDFEIDVCEMIIEETGNDELDDALCRELYKEQLQGDEYRLRILVHGSISPTAEADLIFE